MVNINKKIFTVLQFLLGERSGSKKEERVKREIEVFTRDSGRK